MSNPMSMETPSDNLNMSLSASNIQAIPVNVTPTGWQKAGDRDGMKDHGRHFACCVDMFILLSSVINAGITYDPERPPEQYDDEMRRLHRYWEELNRIAPSLIASLLNPEGRTMKSIGAALLAGSNAARSDDTRSIKIALTGWLSAELKEAGTTLDPVDKTQRGFNNIVTGRHLCPAIFDYDDPLIRELLANHTATIDDEPINGADYQAFLYDMRSYNPATAWETFLRGPLVVSCWFHIFHSPSSALTHTKNSKSNGSRGTRTGVAELYGMTKVTPGSIIYAATHVHFALSSAQVFCKNNKHSDTMLLHQALVEFFEDPTFAGVVEDLLQWWNRIVFPTHIVSRTATRGLQHMCQAYLASLSHSPAAI